MRLGPLHLDLTSLMEEPGMGHLGDPALFSSEHITGVDASFPRAEDADTLGDRRCQQASTQPPTSQTLEYGSVLDWQ